MKLTFVEIGSGNGFISINNGTAAEEFLKEYNIDYIDCGDQLRISEDACAYVPIKTFDDLHFFTEKYYCSVNVMGRNYCIHFYNVHEEDQRTGKCVWDYRNYTMDELLDARERLDDESNSLYIEELDYQLTVLNRAINYMNNVSLIE